MLISDQDVSAARRYYRDGSRAGLQVVAEGVEELARKEASVGSIANLPQEVIALGAPFRAADIPEFSPLPRFRWSDAELWLPIPGIRRRVWRQL